MNRDELCLNELVRCFDRLRKAHPLEVHAEGLPSQMMISNAPIRTPTIAKLKGLKHGHPHET
jgi:hypothetical protein